jgi:hypothetical protein
LRTQGTQEKAWARFNTKVTKNTKDTKDTKDAPMARRLVPGAVLFDLARAKRALVIFVSFVVKTSDRRACDFVFPEFPTLAGMSG